jgi:hypothetical protein
MSRTASGFLILSLVTALSACDGGSTPRAAILGPTSSTPTSPSPGPTATVGLPYLVDDVTVSGVVYEVTSSGEVPLQGVSISNGEGPARMTPQLTDANGFFSFRPVWVCPCAGDPGNGPVAAGMTALIVKKDGYTDPPGLAESVFRPHDTGWRDVMIDGNTHVRLQLVRR